MAKTNYKQIVIEIVDGVVQNVTGVPADYMVRIEHTDNQGMLDGPFLTKPDGTEYVQEVYLSDGHSAELSAVDFGEIADTKPLNSVDLIGKEWFDKTYGNSYFSAQVTVNFGGPDTKTFFLPMRSGHGSAFEWAAYTLLIQEGYLSDLSRGPLSLVLREKGVPYRVTMLDKQLKRDVEAWGEPE